VQVNNPSLQKKNDYSLSLAYSTPSGADLNGGYAITNRLAVIGGLYAYKNKDHEEESTLFSSTRDSSILTYKHKGFHLGLGVYLPLTKDKSPFFLSFFGGYTKGSFDMRENLYQTYPPATANPKSNFYKSNIDRWFLQGSINFYDKIIHQSFITRFNYAGYNNVNTDYTFNEQVSYNLPPQAYPKWSSFLDFSFDTKIFFSKNQTVGLQLFGTATTRVSSKEYNFYIYPFRLGVGLVLKSPFK
jgi:hypothetical protein